MFFHGVKVVTLDKVHGTLSKVHTTLDKVDATLSKVNTTLATLCFIIYVTLKCDSFVCNRCPLKCEARREIDGRNTLQNINARALE
jgi:hypothetical protein